MIKLNRHPQPPATLAGSGANRTRLNNERVERGEQPVKADGEVYGAADVKEALRAQQFAQHVYEVEGGPPVFLRCKCAWCESWVERATSYEEVDHYRPKSLYYWLGYAWDNLIISCKPCNTKKLDQFPIEDEAQRASDHRGDVAQERPLLLNPYEDEPSAHLEWRRHVVSGLTDRGRETIKVVGLTNPTLSSARMEHHRAIRAIRARLESIRGDARWADEADEKLRTLQAGMEAPAKYSAMVRAELGRTR
jgi:uncharacterized protein (TIGR02646 family)